MKPIYLFLTCSCMVLLVQIWMFSEGTVNIAVKPLPDNIFLASKRDEAKTSRLKQPLFDPAKDLRFTNDTMVPYSTHRCVQVAPLQNNFPDYIGRTCLFHNLYFSHEKQQFFYFPSPTELKVKSETLQEDLFVAGGFVIGSGNETTRWYKRKIKFSPVLVESLPEDIMDDVKVVETDVNFVLFKPSYSFNLGHFLFDDVLSIFTMLEFFGKSDRPFAPLFLQEPNDSYFRCHPAFRWEDCLKSWARFMPSLMGVQNLVMTKRWLDQNGYNLRNVRIPTLIAGQGKIANFVCDSQGEGTQECGLHRTPTIRKFRSWLIENVLWGSDEGTLPRTEKGLILVSLPVGNSHKGIEWFKEIIPALKASFGEKQITVVDLATISMLEQAKLVASSNCFLTNMGGGSAVSLFLNEGSTALIFDRFPDEHRYDGLLYDTNGYFRVHWIRSGTRASLVVDAVRLALEQPL